MSNVYTADFGATKFQTTRRGVNATSPILKNGVKVATLHDVAERISTDVVFVNTQERFAFLEAAQSHGFTGSEHFAISEFARHLLDKASNAFLEAVEPSKPKRKAKPLPAPTPEPQRTVPEAGADFIREAFGIETQFERQAYQPKRKRLLFSSSGKVPSFPELERICRQFTAQRCQNVNTSVFISETPVFHSSTWSIRELTVSFDGHRVVFTKYHNATDLHIELIDRSAVYEE
ncbi:hypothetical protein [Ralstonia phage phiRSL1]|uniref:Uncharacterized protein n=1 Tax=Ralstonia phage phiRSL1 TaxID=1980924 RepID=B2ZYC7_9CAUD|nr:hypothetical protein RSL1_ORF301 [Ralstonia phage phiRSL1]BAG41747.1 hypothetical protein [Ralstonia phage phiRSL1]